MATARPAASSRFGRADRVLDRRLRGVDEDLAGVGRSGICRAGDPLARQTASNTQAVRTSAFPADVLVHASGYGSSSGAGSGVTVARVGRSVWEERMVALTLDGAALAFELFHNERGRFEKVGARDAPLDLVPHGAAIAGVHPVVATFQHDQTLVGIGQLAVQGKG